jgi:hypothetical protein
MAYEERMASEDRSNLVPRLCFTGDHLKAVLSVVGTLDCREAAKVPLYVRGGNKSLS